MRKETVVYLERPGLRNLCPADVSLSKRFESSPIPSGVVLWLTACSGLSVRMSNGGKKIRVTWRQRRDRVEEGSSLPIAASTLPCSLAGANRRYQTRLSYMIKTVLCHLSSQLWLFPWLLGSKQKGVRGGAPWSKVSASSQALPELSLFGLGERAVGGVLGDRSLW